MRVEPRVAASTQQRQRTRALAQARGVEGPDRTSSILKPSRDGVDLPSKFPAADHACNHVKHQGLSAQSGNAMSSCSVLLRQQQQHQHSQSQSHSKRGSKGIQ